MTIEGGFGSGLRVDGRQLPPDGSFDFEGLRIRIVDLPDEKRKVRPGWRAVAFVGIVGTFSALGTLMFPDKIPVVGQIPRCRADNQPEDSVPNPVAAPLPIEFAKAPQPAATPRPTDPQCKLISEGGKRAEAADGFGYWIINVDTNRGTHLLCVHQPDGSWQLETEKLPADPTQAAKEGWGQPPNTLGDVQRELEHQVQQVSETAGRGAKTADTLLATAACGSIFILGLYVIAKAL
jgi:hypothetical protein